ARLPGGAGVPALHGHHVRPGQPPGRPALSGVRSAGGGGMIRGMRLRANAVIGGTLIGLLALVSLVANFWTPYEPLRINLRARLRPPSDLFWLGTDEFGRDVVSRLMAGAATSALVALMTVVTAVI